MNEKLIFNCTRGREEPERATLPFIAANIAATAGQEAVVLCTIEAARLGQAAGHHARAAGRRCEHRRGREDSGRDRRRCQVGRFRLKRNDTSARFLEDALHDG